MRGCAPPLAECFNAAPKRHRSTLPISFFFGLLITNNLEDVLVHSVECFHAAAKLRHSIMWFLLHLPFLAQEDYCIQNQVVASTFIVLFLFFGPTHMLLEVTDFMLIMCIQKQRMSAYDSRKRKGRLYTVPIQNHWAKPPTWWHEIGKHHMVSFHDIHARTLRVVMYQHTDFPCCHNSMLH